MFLVSSWKCLEYPVVYSGICKNIFQNPIKKWRRRNQPNLFSAAFSINSISFKEKEVLLPQYIISSLNPFKMCPVLHTGTDKDQNLMTGWRQKRKGANCTTQMVGTTTSLFFSGIFLNVTLLFTLWDFSHMSLEWFQWWFNNFLLFCVWHYSCCYGFNSLEAAKTHCK